MITKNLSITKYVIIIAVFLIGLIACERDIKGIGIGLVDNNKFDTNVLLSNLTAYNKNVDSVRVDSLPQYVLGVNQNNIFGKTTASIASQLSLPSSGVDFGINPTIDSVILDIPYYSTKTGTLTLRDPNSSNDIDSITIPTYQLDSIIGNANDSFQITVSELGTFLNSLDPLDPTKRKKYFSNRSFNTKSPDLYSGTFSPNANDTVAYINHKDFDGAVFDIDTIKNSNGTPSMKLPLDKDFFQSNFINQSSSVSFSSLDEFTHYFRGLYISASGANGSLLTLPLATGNVSIYYSNDVSSTDADGVTTIVRTKQVKAFPLRGIKANKFNHDYSLATSAIQTRLSNPDEVNGEQKLYVQGASGSIIVLNLFSDGNLEELRSKNWLINEANLKLYVDRNETSGNLPNRLFIYNLDDNSHVIDILSEGINVLDGTLYNDSNGDPSYYKFKITKYISQVLKQENPRKLSKLAIKLISRFDVPNFSRLSDTIIKPFNWNPKGVAIFGNKELSDKKLSLEIFYTEIRN
ncbi:MAG: DUF4270 domain-containing protein [Flavobacteriaceae bacterium]|nr:DUF4270 domain-containing protein [Flavobacteriaceae bacterium]